MVGEEERKEMKREKGRPELRENIGEKRDGE